jgi:diadenosine tetraphosphatase ApaH/serine/threonine PP2A family protein phosphatase
VNEYLLEDKQAKTFERIASGADCDVLVFGHTHKPWVREYGDVLFVNCGSVGKPKDGDPRAGFAVLQSRDGGIEVELPRIDYPAGKVAAEMRDVGLPAELADKLVTAAGGHPHDRSH